MSRSVCVFVVAVVGNTEQSMNRGCVRADGLLQCAGWKAVARQMEADGRRPGLRMVDYLIAKQGRAGQLLFASTSNKWA